MSKNSRSKILVVDDEESICQLLEIMLSEEGYSVRTAQNAENALRFFSIEPFDLVISDIMMPNVDGISFLKDLRQIDREVPVIMITAYASLNTAVEALRSGATDYITKPFPSNDHIRNAVKRALENRILKRENRILKQAIKSQSTALDKFIGSSKQIGSIKDLVRKVSPTESTVLITGESGTGKELIARAIHQNSKRNNGPFVTINCAALPETLLESELFGYVKGAFTGANKDKDGLFKTADGGTFFLDEVGETSLTIQAKLLRILETSEFTPLGATKPVTTDCRLIAATNRDLKKMVDDSFFRGDLYYRLNVIRIHIPPLRERRDDIIPIAEHILINLSARMGEELKELSINARDILQHAIWEGNVRELENVLERAVFLCRDITIELEHLPEYLRERPDKATTKTEPRKNLTESNAFDEINLVHLEELEKAYIYWALMQTDENKAETARLLGIDLSTLYRKIDKYGLKRFLSGK